MAETLERIENNAVRLVPLTTLSLLERMWQGIAVHPTTGAVYGLSPAANTLITLDAAGTIQPRLPVDIGPGDAPLVPAPHPFALHPDGTALYAPTTDGAALLELATSPPALRATVPLTASDAVAGEPAVRADLVLVFPTPTEMAGCLMNAVGPLAEVRVVLRQDGAAKQTATTDVRGCYAFSTSVPDRPLRLKVKRPPGGPVGHCLMTSPGAVADLAVGLRQKGATDQTARTDAAGCVSFSTSLPERRLNITIDTPMF